MRKFKVKDEFIDSWTDHSESTEEIIVTDEEIERLSKEWDVPVQKLMNQVLALDDVYGVTVKTEDYDPEVNEPDWYDSYGEAKEAALEAIKEEDVVEVVINSADPITGDYSDLHHSWQKDEYGTINEYHNGTLLWA